MRPELERYFAAVTPYLDGSVDLATFETRVGSSPSGARGLAFYQRLMAANRRRILRHVHPLVHAVCSAPTRAGLDASAPSWTFVVERYTRAVVPAHWDPNELGRDFAAWLAEAYPVLAPLAVWSWSLLATARAPLREPGERLDPSVAAASYTFDVAAWASRFERGDPVVPLPVAAREGPAIVLTTYRDPSTLRAMVLRPSVAELVVLADAAGDGGDVMLPPAERARAESRLVALGLIAVAAPA